MIYIKIHKTKENGLIAVCDENLIGKKFEEGDLCLNVSNKFYKGELMDESSAEKILIEANNINFVGENAVNLGLKLGLILKEHILVIKGVKHAQSCK